MKGGVIHKAAAFPPYDARKPIKSSTNVSSISTSGSSSMSSSPNENGRSSRTKSTILLILFGKTSAHHAMKASKYTYSTMPMIISKKKPSVKSVKSSAPIVAKPTDEPSTSDTGASKKASPKAVSTCISRMMWKILSRKKIVKNCAPNVSVNENSMMRTLVTLTSKLSNTKWLLFQTSGLNITSSTYRSSSNSFCSSSLISPGIMISAQQPIIYILAVRKHTP